ncbi:MAG: cobalamin-dependent protein [Bryobacteraceae bacterium]
MHWPVRLLTAVPICDGHDSAINTLNMEFIRHGIEVVYLGFHRSASDVARAAVQEGVGAVGISSYNGGHIEFFHDVRKDLDRRGGAHIGVFGGGGGTISRADAGRMKHQGTDEIFFAGTPLETITGFVTKKYGRRRRPAEKASRQKSSAPVVGFTGPGGSGKTTLIDEVVLRFLETRPRGRIAILSHDPSTMGGGALLGDRAMMIHSQHDRVFMRSLATGGQAGGLSPETEPWLDSLRHQEFEFVLVETVGAGQEAMPFRDGLFDRKILVMPPDYGSRLQLQKVVMLDAADVVVVNKSDQPRAKAAQAEIGQRLSENGRGQKLVSTEARRHRDHGVDELFQLLTEVGR